MRPGAGQALVQAVFDDDGESLSVARRITRNGRSRAFVDGLVSSLPAVEAALRERVAFYGQLEHARLLQLDRQLDLLDAWAGADVAALLDDYGAAWSQSQCALAGAAGTARRRDAIASASSTCCAFRSTRSRRPPSSRARTSLLKVERERLRHSEKLVDRVGGAIVLLFRRIVGAAGARRPAHGRAAAGRSRKRSTRALAAAAGRLAGLTAEADDLLGVLRAYLDDLDVEPGSPRRGRAALRPGSPC